MSGSETGWGRHSQRGARRRDGLSQKLATGERGYFLHGTFIGFHSEDSMPGKDEESGRQPRRSRQGVHLISWWQLRAPELLPGCSSAVTALHPLASTTSLPPSRSTRGRSRRPGRRIVIVVVEQRVNPRLEFWIVRYLNNDVMHGLEIPMVMPNHDCINRAGAPRSTSTTGALFISTAGRQSPPSRRR